MSEARVGHSWAVHIFRLVAQMGHSLEDVSSWVMAVIRVEMVVLFVFMER